jgi:hypothetical protein
MTEKLSGMSPTSTKASQQPSAEELEAARELVRQARTRGVDLTGPQGLLKALTKTVIETALDEEMSTLAAGQTTVVSSMFSVTR